MRVFCNHSLFEKAGLVAGIGQTLRMSSEIISSMFNIISNFLAFIACRGNPHEFYESSLNGETRTKFCAVIKVILSLSLTWEMGAPVLK